MSTQTYRKLVAEKLGRDFRDAVKIVEEPVPTPASDQIVVRNRFAGVNASDVNITAGVYFANPEPPFDLGVEAAGEVVAVGTDVDDVEVGQHVLTNLLGGGYREYQTLNANLAIPVPEATPEVLSVVVAGMTASMALHVGGNMGREETVLITAAAGGVGQYAVQLAKQAGNYVIGTCSTEEKAAHLREIGCDHPINYEREDVDAVLREEYPDGVDLVLEGVGGELFDACVNNLGVRGRMVVIGYVSEYLTSAQPVTRPRIYSQLLWKSAMVRGFLFSDYVEQIPEHLEATLQAFYAGDLNANVDPTQFEGIESIVDAVEYMHAKKNCGKVIVHL